MKMYFGYGNSYYYQNSGFLYESKNMLMSKSEQMFYEVLKETVPQGFYVFPQMNLAAFIEKTDHSRYRNELFRNIDFLITDGYYVPKLAVEINDRTHLTPKRKERDRKVQNILEEAGIPLLTLWVRDGIDRQRIFVQIEELLIRPVQRVKHSSQGNNFQQQIDISQQSNLQNRQQNIYQNFNTYQQQQQFLSQNHAEKVDTQFQNDNKGINPLWPIKSKIVAGLLGIFLGGIGIHKFYLGKTGIGMIYILFSWTLIPMIVGFIEGIFYLCLSDDDFQIFNSVRLH